MRTLHDALRKWYDTKPLKVISEFNPDESAYVYRFEYSTIPVSLGIIIGDIFHEMRSALDTLVWQLALLTTSTPYDKTAFPICIRQDGKSRKHMNRLLQNVSDDARKVIYSLQPYNAGNETEARSDPLWFIDKVSNFDKHRIITANSILTDVTLAPGVSKQWLNDGAVKVFVHVHDKNFPPAPLNIKPRLLVGSNIVGNGIPLSGIRILNDYLRFDVLPLFESFFLKSKENVK